MTNLISGNNGQEEEFEGYTQYCNRCGGEVKGCDHDDEILACGNCIPFRLADLTRRPAWYDGNTYDLDARINLRGKEAFGVHSPTPSAKTWPHYMGKEHWREDRQKDLLEGRI